MLIYIFTFLGFFAIILVTLPSGFLVSEWSGTYQTDKEAAKMFSAANITMYQSAATFQLGAFPDSHQESLGLPAGHYIEFWWDYELRYTLEPFLEARHVKDVWFWQEYERLFVLPPYDAGVYNRKFGLLKSELVGLWGNEVENASFCAWGASGYYVSAFIYPNKTGDTIGQAWDQGYLNFTISYQIDWNATQLNAWNLMAQIMTFQSPDLGLGSGVHNTIFNAFVALPLWIMIAILIVKLIFAFIPTSSGVSD